MGNRKQPTPVPTNQVKPKPPPAPPAKRLHGGRRGNKTDAQLTFATSLVGQHISMAASYGGTGLVQFNTINGAGRITHFFARLFVDIGGLPDMNDHAWRTKKCTCSVADLNMIEPIRKCPVHSKRR